MVRGSLEKLASRALSVAGRWQHQQLRRLNIHEYQATGLMARGAASRSMQEVNHVLKNPFPREIFKRQFLSGSQGLVAFKGGLKGGVHIGEAEEARANACKMGGQILVMKQTGPEGKILSKVYFCERLLLTNDMYFAITVDRKTAGPVIIACNKGGTSIEDFSENYPDKIVKVTIDVSRGITDEDAAKVVDGLDQKEAIRKSSMEQIKKLYELFCKCDCTLLEINPFPEPVDNNLLYSSQEDCNEAAVATLELKYTGLEEGIDRLVNGTGLRYVSKLHGGTPANLLSGGGGAKEGMVKRKFEILTSDRLEPKTNPYHHGFKAETIWYGERGDDNLPTWVDWTLCGAVTPVQDQILPGPCWAFPTIGAIEAANFLYTKKLVKLSEQQLIDCNNVASAEAYPYVADQQICKPFTTQLYTISGVKIVTQDCEKALKKAVWNGPVAAGIHYNSDYMYYSGGVLRSCNSRLLELNHAVLVVGYGFLDGQAAWKLKDSEGEIGPYNGYKYIARDVYEAGGTLGIARYCVYPRKNHPNKVGLVRSESDMGIKKSSVRSIDTFYRGLPKPE